MTSAPFAFVYSGLDRADHLRSDPEALAGLWPSARVLLLDDDGRAATQRDGAFLVATGTEVESAPHAASFLGLREGIAWFAMPMTAGPPTNSPTETRIDVRTAATAWPGWMSAIFAQARALLHWQARHRHCGSCGSEVEFVRAGWLGRCRGCTQEHYPRTDPAVIMAVTDGQRLLLGRQARWPAGRWSLLAGFVEPGETPEQTVARETLEESGVRVRECRYLAAQPWPFPGGLMLGYTADAHPDTPRANDELEDARWFDAGAIRRGLARSWDDPIDSDADAIALSSPISIARWLIEQWLQTYCGHR